MAVLARCVTSPPSPSGFHGGNHTSEDVVFLPFRKEKGAMLSEIIHVSSYKRLDLPSNESKLFEGGIFDVSRFRESTADWTLSGFCLDVLQRISDHQIFFDPDYSDCFNLKGIKLSSMHFTLRREAFSFTKSFVWANSLMLIMPLNALAETCEPDNSFFNMPLLFGIALIGATVGGLLARQRKGELKRVNDQLRQINAALRRQAKIESYAPNLSYALVSRIPEAEVVVDPRKQQLITNLRTGKNYLRNQEVEKAFTEFKAALELAQALGDHVEEKKAARGLGASLQRQGKYKDAIKYHSRVLEISKLVGEDSGTTEAYGAIADCYTELGDLERAGKFYDKYIARLET